MNADIGLNRRAPRFRISAAPALAAWGLSAEARAATAKVVRLTEPTVFTGAGARFVWAGEAVAPAAAANVSAVAPSRTLRHFAAAERMGV
jgi:hypothetical protein